MLFNSIAFAVFLPVTFLLYWFLFNKNLKGQNFFLLVVSYVFYGWWDWRFLVLIAFSSGLDFFVGLQLQKIENHRKRKFFFALSCIVNLGFLGFFKYYNFFENSFVDAFAAAGIHLEVRTLRIILPVGISFYTFQSLSYTIDIYRKKITPTKDILAFFAFVSFFPHLVAGPIMRAANLLPQFNKRRTFDYNLASDGMRQILWGLFKKMVIADGCAACVNQIFGSYETLPGSVLLLGAVYFAFQIYGDFSGYSDIAIGTARLFGFDLMQNFAYPYFSRDIAEFWRRWHISLTSWFRDYVYIPLGGSRKTLGLTVRNTLIVFLLCGFWHGANWTFIVWGLLHALYFIPLLLLKRNREHIDVVALNKLLPSIKELFQMLLTFFLVVIAWIFFRAENLKEAFNYIAHLMSPSLFSFPTVYRSNMILVAILIIVEWIQREKQHALEIEGIKHPAFRWIIYSVVCFTIYFFGINHQPFIYFQF